MKKELFLSLETGDVAKIQRLHMQNSSVLMLEFTFVGDSPLHVAAREGHLPIVEWILQVEPSLARVENEDGNTPLHEAARCGNPAVVAILLQHRLKSAYLFNKFEQTALIIASMYGHLETVKILLKAKEYNVGLEIRLSLEVASYRGYTDIVKAILAGNPIKPALRRYHYRLLDGFFTIADWKSIHERSFKQLPIGLSRDDIESTGATPNLHAAVHGGHVELVQAILRSSAWKDNMMTKKDKFGRCAIHVAAMRGSWDIINEFMSRWPDSVQIRSSDHKSLLHYAVEYNQFDVVHNLLLNKPPQKVADLLVEYLVSFPGVDVNALNNEVMTALDIASAADKSNPNCAIIEQKLKEAGGICLNFMPKSNKRNENESKQGADKDMANTQIVVASLIATVTFTAIFQIPGGIEDDKRSIHYGAAKMAFHKLFRMFIISDVFAFLCSFTVVVAWLLGQLLGDTHFGRISGPSVVILLYSTVWTITAFVCATIIVTVPPNYKNLKSTHKEAFYAYESLLGLETGVLAFSAVYFSLPLLTLASLLLTGSRKTGFFKFVMYWLLSIGIIYSFY